MKNFVILLVLFPFFNIFSFAVDSKQEETALQFINYIFLEQNWDKCGEMFDTTLASKEEISKIFKAGFEQITKTYGDFTNIEIVKKEQKDDSTYTLTKNITFATGKTLGINVSLNNSGRVIGSWYVEPIYIDANYVRKEAEQINGINIKTRQEFDIYPTKDSLLLCKLTVPIPAFTQQNQQIPCVVLVHGSGPLDYDATVGNNKIFRDIALGLVSNDIAVFRYNKRTLVDNKLKADTLTVYGETINDAIEIVKYIRQEYAKNFNRIYILGHSLGAYVMPLIAERSDADGFVLVSTPARSLAELMKEQLEYIDSIAYKDEITKTKNIIAGNYNLNTPNDSMPLNLPPIYFYSLKDYNPIKRIEQEKRPVLMLQGDRDYQVTSVDFRMYEDGLRQKKNFTFKLLNGLNHLLQKGTTPSIPAEYNKKINVDESVISSIVNWINIQQ